ncbi:MAG TPA: MurR/RpiR family transcriptional regulator [Candidatus Lachnoclostridium stercorigallinarum]|uniref:MurR/RpiR family transcriptional regulator n=1 Tax=Candidatus Lachnoclostridium stercorigallinarum TaxID=2838634 RepID=A0A9D2GIL4_9FIRM|nr:MurR/RpiR family transcriptional regulator [Candidatus Lachnoclostridium stercorigallinarum]
MLIQERLERCELSVSERAAADFILKEKLNIRDMTTREIAQASFSSPSTLVRIAHKMNFRGWNELKEALLKEEEYLQTHFSDIDANLPFKRTDSIMSVAAKIAALKKESIDDTLSLITHDDLQKAVLLLNRASSISVFAVSNNALICREFQHNMNRIGKRVEVCGLQGEFAYTAWLAEPSSCALIISYSGETPILVKAAKILKEHRIPTVLITNIGENSLLPMADCVLRICTREKLYSKIATFSTDASIEYLLDVLYSCIFRLDYDQYLQMKIQSAQEIEHGRSRSTVDIIREDSRRSDL